MKNTTDMQVRLKSYVFFKSMFEPVSRSRTLNLTSDERIALS